MEERLQKFAVLVEKGSFTKAAKALYISQPALTLAIGKLERELRTSLLTRGKRQLELTDAGRLVYKAAIEHRTTDDNLRTRLTELARKRPRVTIGMIDSMAAALNDEAEALEELEARADVSIIVNHSRYLRSAVENHEIDLAFAVQESTVHPSLDVKPIGTEPFVLVCRPDRFKNFQTALGTKKLPEFISYDRHSTTYGHIHYGLRKLGIGTPRPTLHSTSPTIMLHTILRGHGVAVLPYALTKDLLGNGRLAALKKDGETLTITCPLSVVKLRGKILPKPLGVFMGQARTVLSELQQM